MKHYYYISLYCTEQLYLSDGLFGQLNKASLVYSTGLQHRFTAPVYSTGLQRRFTAPVFAQAANYVLRNV